MLNQRVIDVFPYTKSMQNDIVAISTYSTRESDKFNRVKYYNFIINDTDQDSKKEPTVYQHLKQKNFAGDDSTQKRLLIKVVDRLDSKHKILNKQTGLSNASRYNYEQIQFEPVLASTVLAEQEEERRVRNQNALIGVYVYGRVDMQHSNFNLSSIRIREPQMQQVRFPIQYIDTKDLARPTQKRIQG